MISSQCRLSGLLLPKWDGIVGLTQPDDATWQPLRCPTFRMYNFQLHSHRNPGMHFTLLLELHASLDSGYCILVSRWNK